MGFWRVQLHGVPNNMLPIKTAACVFLLLARAGWAVESDPCAARPTTSDVQFSIAMKGGQTVFQQGEAIPLVMSTTATVTHRYWADSRGANQYCLEPAAPDPMEAHDKRRMMQSFDGLFNEWELGKKPYSADATLNLRFRLAPGHYVFYVVSMGIWHPAGAGELEGGKRPEDGHISEVVRSNDIEFDVWPVSAEWQHQQVQAAVAVLTHSKSVDELARAAEALRILDTKESTRALAKMLGVPGRQDWNGELSDGLYGSSHHRLAMDAMRAEMAAPETAVSSNFLDTLVELQEDSDGLDDSGDGSQPDALKEFWRRQGEARERYMKAAVDEAVSALPRKQGAARAVTLDAVLREAGKDAAMVQSLRLALIGAWNDLPTATREDLLEWQWQLIGGPEMLPVLRGIVAQPPNGTGSALMRNLALRRVYELDPEEGGRLILRDLLNANAEPTMQLVKRLSQDEISLGVPAAVGRIDSNKARALDFGLLDRYAGPEALGSVQAVLDASIGKQGCDPQAKMLRYTLRVAPEYGAVQVRAAMAARKDTGCYHTLLRDLGDQLPAAQQIAINALDDEDAEVQRSAAEALGHWGTAEAEQSLWDRLTRLHDEWAGRTQELHAVWELDSPGSSAIAMEQALADAIVRGHGWLIRPEDLMRLEALLLTDNERRQIAYSKFDWKKSPLTITPLWNGDLDPTFQLLQYEELSEDQLVAKLSQLPRGTKFDWQMIQADQMPDPVSIATQEAEFEKIRVAAAENGMEILSFTRP